jgi:HAMP domain-containing protein
MDNRETKLALESTTPAKVPSSEVRWVAGSFGFFAGVWAVAMLVYGIIGILRVIQKWGRLDGVDMLRVGMFLLFLLFGALCAYAACRWIPFALRRH